MARDKSKLRIADVMINGFSKEGHGLGTFVQQDGTASLVEVPFCIPGDQAKVSLLKRRKGVCQSQLLEIVHPSSDRIEPQCIHFAQCGGCRWQQITYEHQLKIKEQRISRCLEPYINSDTISHPIIACSPPWQYRNKVELTFSSDKAMNRYLGFILYASRGKVFNLHECHLVPQWMNSVVHAVREWWNESDIDAYHAFKDTGSLRTLTLRAGQRTGDKMVILTVSGNADFALKQNQLNQFVDSIKQIIATEDTASKLSIFLRIQQIAKGQKTNFYEMQLYGPDHICEIMHLPDGLQKKQAYTFNISPAAFFQPNTQQAEKLYTRVLEMVRPAREDLVYDLYCGTATLGISFASFVKEVIGIELSPESVLDARENIKRNQLTNITIHQGDVAKILPLLIAEENKKPNIVIVDPPRAGLDAKAIQHLIDIRAPKIAYVSCNPTTQAENLKILIEAGYQVQEIQPVEQFPQTVHVENIVILKLESNLLGGSK
jgi:23S rRNA (uracil1939-C5)-methyltransferase